MPGRLKWLAPLLLAVCMLPFVAGLQGPFLLDDFSNLDGARAATGTFGEIIYAIVHNDSGLLRRPLANLSFLINYQWFGSEPFSYKLVNLALHWLNACLVWLLATRILALLYPERRTEALQATSLFIAALWAIHPIQVSSVLYIVQRMAEMSAFFTLLALLVFLRAMQRPTAHALRDLTLRIVAVAAILLLAIFSKENAALFPCFLLAIYFSAPDSTRQFFTRDTSSKVLFFVYTWIPLLLGALVVIAGFSWLTRSYDIRDFTLTDRIFTEPFVLLRYLHSILLPDIRLMGLYLDDATLHHASEPLAWLMLLTTLALPLAAITIRKHAPALTFAVLWYLSAHLLESTILPLEISFEHRNYLALLGPVFAAGYYFVKIIADAPLKLLRLAAIVPVFLLGAETMVRTHQWSDARMFLEHEVENHPFSARAQNAAVELDIEAGDIDRAIARVKTVQSLHPHLFWPLSLDFNLACGIPGHVVHWDRMEAQIRDKPSDPWIISMLQFDANGYLKSNCRHVDPVRFDSFLTVVADIFRSNGMLGQAEQILVLRSYIAKYRKQPDKVREFLASGAQIHPEGVIALSDLAYFELNEGNLDAAATAIDQFDARVRIWAPTRQFEAQELRGYLAQALREKSEAEMKPHGHE